MQNEQIATPLLDEDSLRLRSGNINLTTLEKSSDDTRNQAITPLVNVMTPLEGDHQSGEGRGHEVKTNGFNGIEVGGPLEERTSVFTNIFIQQNNHNNWNLHQQLSKAQSFNL